MANPHGYWQVPFQKSLNREEKCGQMAKVATWRQVQSKYCCSLWDIHHQVSRNPVEYNKEQCEACKLPRVSRATGCKASKGVVRAQKAQRRPPCRENLNKKCISGMKNMWKLTFLALFTRMSAEQHWVDQISGPEDGYNSWEICINASMSTTRWLSHVLGCYRWRSDDWTISCWGRC